MRFNAFINFDGDCKKAVEFYAKVFGQKTPKMMTFGDSPQSEGYEVSKKDKNRILYAELIIGDKKVMFCDSSSEREYKYISGNNISLVIESKDVAEIKKIYGKLKLKGEVIMPLCETFFSKSFGVVRDKFGIIWQLSHFK